MVMAVSLSLNLNMSLMLYILFIFCCIYCSYFNIKSLEYILRVTLFSTKSSSLNSGDSNQATLSPGLGNNQTKEKTIYNGKSTTKSLRSLTVKEDFLFRAAAVRPREPRRDSRGERSPWLPLETRPSSTLTKLRSWYRVPSPHGK